MKVVGVNHSVNVPIINVKIYRGIKIHGGDE
jgi:hypothetical protein